jgi:hypothetical protein
MIKLVPASSEAVPAPIKNAIAKFRDEFEEYIKQSNPTGYMETDPVPALPILSAH